MSNFVRKDGYVPKTLQSTASIQADNKRLSSIKTKLLFSGGISGGGNGQRLPNIAV